MAAEPNPKKRKHNNSLVLLRKQVLRERTDDPSSDSDEEEGILDKDEILAFFNNGTKQELTAIQGCGEKKAEILMKMRPFEGWEDLHSKFQSIRNIYSNGVALLNLQKDMERLMKKCEKMAGSEIVEGSTSGESSKKLTEQPKSIPNGLKLTRHQMKGLNWLVWRHEKNLNGILVDQLRSGEITKSVTFLAHLKELGYKGPHLIIVNSISKWLNELASWGPNLKVLHYQGLTQIVEKTVEHDVILTTYNLVCVAVCGSVLFRKLNFHYVIFDEACSVLKNMSNYRYGILMRVQAQAFRKLLLLNRYPLQNNMHELMSLLVFVLPEMFAYKEQLEKMLLMFPKTRDEDDRTKFEMDRIQHAKRIMKQLSFIYSGNLGPYPVTKGNECIEGQQQQPPPPHSVGSDHVINEVMAIRDRLLQGLDQEYNVVYIDIVTEVISKLESCVITKDALKATRLGKHINQLRRKTNDRELALRAWNLIKKWQEFLPTSEDSDKDIQIILENIQDKQPEPTAAGDDIRTIQTKYPDISIQCNNRPQKTMSQARLITISKPGGQKTLALGKGGPVVQTNPRPMLPQHPPYRSDIQTPMGGQNTPPLVQAPKVKPQASVLTFDSMETTKSQFICHMCLRSPTASYVLNCGHLPFCEKCSNLFIRETRKCPLCKSKVISKQRVYLDLMKTKANADEKDDANVISLDDDSRDAI